MVNRNLHSVTTSSAKDILVASDRSISEIACQLSFEDAPYFSRLFKKEVGMSPKEYKNQLLNGFNPNPLLPRLFARTLQLTGRGKYAVRANVSMVCERLQAHALPYFPKMCGRL
jgi:AraC-like DNA-binding protein